MSKCRCHSCQGCTCSGSHDQTEQLRLHVVLAALCLLYCKHLPGAQVRQHCRRSPNSTRRSIAAVHSMRGQHLGLSVPHVEALAQRCHSLGPTGLKAGTAATLHHLCKQNDAVGMLARCQEALYAQHLCRHAHCVVSDCSACSFQSRRKLHRMAELSHHCLIDWSHQPPQKLCWTHATKYKLMLQCKASSRH